MTHQANLEVSQRLSKNHICSMIYTALIENGVVGKCYVDYKIPNIGRADVVIMENGRILVIVIVRNYKKKKVPTLTSKVVSKFRPLNITPLFCGSVEDIPRVVENIIKIIDPSRKVPLTLSLKTVQVLKDKYLIHNTKDTKEGSREELVSNDTKSGLESSPQNSSDISPDDCDLLLKIENTKKEAQSIVGCYYRLWFEKYGVKPLIRPHYFKQTYAILEHYNPDEIRRAVETFLKVDRKFENDSKHNFGVFLVSVDRYIAETKQNDKPERTRGRER